MANKNVIELLSRYGKSHTLTETDVEGQFVFRPAESWMPIYITYEKGGSGTINAIDSDGGPMIGVGFVIQGRTIKSIFGKGDEMIVEFE